MRIEELVIYKNLKHEDILQDMVRLMESFQEERNRTICYDCMNRLLEFSASHGFYGNLWHTFLANLLVNHENSYSMACEIRGGIEGTINQLVLHDIRIFKELYDYDFTDMMETLQIPEFSMILSYDSPSKVSKVYNTRIRDRICHLAERFNADNTPEEMKETLTEFYRDYGVGKFGLHKAFRIRHGDEGAAIEPILNIAHVHLDDLVGYEIPKQKLIDNTEAFVSGRRANNCLLFGDAGTGKSSSIKAIANQYYDRGLRIIEIYKHQFRDLNDVISQIKNRNYKFILYMDDLSFEDFETEYKYLKAVIEGGLEKKPDNILIYATSNRRHLVREKFSDKEDRRDDLHAGDTVQEKLSLAARFGVTIFFSAPDKKQFQEIVTVLAKRYGVEMNEEELLLEANKWELAHGGLSGRTAQQFMDYLLGKESL
ncbi:MAG: ATP-binding protein [Bacillus sp. (in: Bacteria)]|nr:ATP-binding protein [Bacillus sp. (in: firmicutes)]MCM1427089.1 ATP-binding protein [Eubacterium sp.]